MERTPGGARELIQRKKRMTHVFHLVMRCVGSEEDIISYNILSYLI